MKKLNHKKYFLFARIFPLIAVPFFLSLAIFFISLPLNIKQYAQTLSGSVSIQDFQFTPATVTIPVGGTVTWTNQSQGGHQHTTTSDTAGTANSWDSGLMNPGNAFSKTFSAAGTYAFHCNVHTFMRGTVVVVGANTTPIPTPTPSPTMVMSPQPTFVCVGLGTCPQTPTPTIPITVIPSFGITQSPDFTPIPTISVSITPMGKKNPDDDDKKKNTNKKKRICTLVKVNKGIFEELSDLLHAKKTQQFKKICLTVPKNGHVRESFLRKLIRFIQELIAWILRFLQQNPPTPAEPTPTPTIPMPSMTMLTPSPSAVSIDSIKYTQGNAPLKSFNFIAQVSGDQWTYNGIAPGPEIRVNQGDHVRVNFLNNLPVATTIHWHGIRIFASQDGVPGTTQNAVQPGKSFTYDFLVPDGGTYWYHTHQDTVNQLPKGLYGPLIVLPTQEPIHYDRDYTVQYRNMIASASGSTVIYPGLPGEKIRLRIINSRAGDFTGAPVTAALIGVPFQIIALDGHDITAPQTIQNQLLPIGMAQRYDLAFTMPATGAAQLVELDKIQSATFGTGTVAGPPDVNTLPVFDFTNYGLPAPDPRILSSRFDVNYTLTIGQNLSINGQIYPDIPDLVIKQGQLIHIHIVNNSNFTHPMHLHGHMFSVLKMNEKPLTGSPIHLDTILIPPLETADIAFPADNPGIWMLHCHVLAHAASGLMMMVRYDTVYTPYMSGPGTGNIPE